MSEPLAQPQHDSLDGIPDPSENPVLIGHLEAQRILLAAQAAGRMPHAVILSGPQGIGKATFAFHLARHLLSGAPSAGGRFSETEPASGLFRQVASGAHPAVLHLTRPQNDKGNGFKTILAVDEIRRIGHFLSMTQAGGGYRVVIVDPADDLRSASANALLKNLEEPPRNAIFLLISHSAGRLLPTIRSRCQMVRLSPLSDPEMEQVLHAVGNPIGTSDDRAAILARAEGSARKAIQFSQYGGVEIASTLEELVRNPADIKTQHRLAEAVSGRDRAAHMAIFNDHALTLLAGAASTAANAGDAYGAKRIADAWQQARIAISEAETYNLDQKQHALTMIGRLSQALNSPRM